MRSRHSRIFGTAIFVAWHILSAAQLVDSIYSDSSLLWWRELVYTVSEIEDMPLCIFGIVKEPGYPGAQFFLRQEQGKRVYIALHCFVPDSFDCIGNIYPPVKTNYIGTGIGRVFQQSCSVVGKIDDRQFCFLEGGR